MNRSASLLSPVETAASADEIEFILKALPLRGLSAGREGNPFVRWMTRLARLVTIRLVSGPAD